MKTTTTIQYIKKSVYGLDKLYIIGEHKKSIETLTGKKTVNKKDIEALQALGLNLEYKAQ